MKALNIYAEKIFPPATLRKLRFMAFKSLGRGPKHFLVIIEPWRS